VPFERHQLMWGPGPGNGIGMFILMIAFWFLIAAAIVFFVRHWSHGHPEHHAHAMPGPVGDSPVDVLKMRFAKGEVDEEEFTKRLKLLQGDK